MENLRKLASIRKISDIQIIPGADMIELAIVDGWKVVVAKNVGHKVGDMVVYCEIDSFLPIKEEFEFLQKSSYKKMSDGTEGFRLRTIKLKGQVSQGLILPLKDLQLPNKDLLEVGMDVTNLLGISKYEPPIPAELSGKVKGLFPSFLRKTDEERIQNLSDEYENLKQHKFYVTEKLDGSSATFYFSLNKNLLDITLNEIFLSKLLITTPSLSKFEFNTDFSSAYVNNSSMVSGRVNSLSNIGTDFIPIDEINFSNSSNPRYS